MSEVDNYMNMANSVSLMQTALIEIRDISQKILDLTKHIHEAHWHGVVHCVDDFSKTGTSFVSSIDESSLLMSEFNNKIDKDDNGLIFGFDFIIDKLDLDCPPSLREIEGMMIMEGMKIPSKMGWGEYQSTLPCN